MCTSRKYPYLTPPHPPTEGSFALDPLEFLFQGVLVIPPPTPWNFRNFFARLRTLRKEYLCQKMLLHDIIMRKIIFPAIK